ncbi:MAG: hypothetical protein HYV07_13255 [Deltaproteobacteria bacterium]|nr:hypothetical protein [Deltaproteobacteria bacterium]
MSHALHLELTLETDLVVSERGSTLGGHRCLRYIPGSLLLGYCAGPEAPGGPTRYDQLAPEASFRIFHSGRVRFGWALPAAGSVPALAVPLSWHAPKRAEGAVLDFSRSERVSGHEQLRGSFVAAGRKVKPEVAYSLRTAVEEHGRAAAGFLFGIESLRAGQRFLARIEADEAADLEFLRRALLRPRIRMGRSKSSEFGSLLVREVDGWSHASGPVSENFVRFYCQSDLCLRDARTGAPSTVPSADAFGLPAGWRLDSTRTFLRTRVYSPFNSYRRRPDLERQLIEVGSVISFVRGDGAGIDAARLRSQLAAGLGEHREQGLGQLLIEPKLLEPPAKLEVAEGAERQTAPSIPEDELGAWLKRKIERRTASEETFKAASEAAKLLREFDLPRSQWGAIRSIGFDAQRNHESAATLVARVSDHVHGRERDSVDERGELRRKGSARLSDRWGQARRDVKAGELLLSIVENTFPSDPMRKAAALEQLGALMARGSRQGGA